MSIQTIFKFPRNNTKLQKLFRKKYIIGNLNLIKLQNNLN